jgi:hypothetical protein
MRLGSLSSAWLAKLLVPALSLEVYPDKYVLDDDNFIMAQFFTIGIGKSYI